MFQIAVIGSGQIGRLVGVALCQQPYYQVHLIDQAPIDKNIDFKNEDNYVFEYEMGLQPVINLSKAI